MFASRSFLPVSLAASFVTQSAFAAQPHSKLQDKSIGTDVNVVQAMIPSEETKIPDQILYNRLKPGLLVPDFSPEKKVNVKNVQLPDVQGHAVRIISNYYEQIQYEVGRDTYQFASEDRYINGKPCDPTKSLPDSVYYVNCLKETENAEMRDAIFELVFDVSSDLGTTYCDISKIRQDFEIYEKIDWSYNSKLGDRVECSGPIAATDAVEFLVASSKLYTDTKITNSTQSDGTEYNLFPVSILAATISLAILVKGAIAVYAVRSKKNLPAVSAQHLSKALTSSSAQEREKALSLLRTLIQRGHEDGNGTDDQLNNLDLNHAMAELISYCRVELLSWKSNDVLVDCLRAIEMIVESHPEKIRLKDELKSVLQSRSGLWSNHSRVAYLARSIGESIR